MNEHYACSVFVCSLPTLTWGMDKVLETDLHSMGDRNRIQSEASRFSRDFLVDLCYFD